MWEIVLSGNEQCESGSLSLRDWNKEEEEVTWEDGWRTEATKRKAVELRRGAWGTVAGLREGEAPRKKFKPKLAPKTIISTNDFLARFSNSGALFKFPPSPDPSSPSRGRGHHHRHRWLCSFVNLNFNSLTQIF